ncbi:hypothetical protein KFL_000020270 [Klebsormidium nitens]|uniref:Cilia- and flagella-associated protein 52 n=1 Tax=Klebsormidium nitens TaxID=105231 RepID=A0A1Y1HGV8_KLENI|nr:hypothetical protein KFL_000020270 [Klebsormidium nitens]|eukprot:GAQ77665.1 hypothetical protein KFL_000020270 [Klebsormidium nitens]
MAEDLRLDSVIGIGGGVPNGLLLHPDGSTLIYPLGSTVIIRPKGDARRQEFLQGHTDKVACIAVSKSGRYLASGQVTHMGFNADIIIWDFETRQMVHRMALHKVKVQALCFSHDDRYLASLGGEDDGNLVVWNVELGQAICGSPTANDFVLTVQFFHNDSTRLVTGGNYNLNVWEFDEANRKVRPAECHLGLQKRVCQSMVVDERDEFVYVGTKTGDVLQVSLGPKLFKQSGPKPFIGQGVSCLIQLPGGDTLVAGGGDGSITLLRAATLKAACSLQLNGGAVTSVVLSEGPARDGSFLLYAGTARCNVYLVRFDARDNKLTSTQVQSCHHEKITDVCFPANYGDVFATCSLNEIRIWHAAECRELLRIQVSAKMPDVECLCIAFMEDGKSVISGWSDGKIRAFGPQSGKLLYTITDAHVAGVTAIVGTSDSTKIVSGGKEGQVRVWRIGQESQTLISSMKEHKGPVNAIQVRRNDSEAVSASSDGSCIIWDLARFVRNNSLFASTFFKAILYHPDESQLLTTGTDRKITYWDAYDGQVIRNIEGSKSAEINALAISADGEAVASGGADKEVKLWGYDEGHCFAVGRGHSGAVLKVKISPDLRKVVSVGEEGAILIWDYISPRSLSAPRD